MPTYRELFNLCRKKMDVSWVHGQTRAEEQIKPKRQAERYPALSIGFLNIIHPERLHMLGEAELRFLNDIGSVARVSIVQKLAEDGSLGLTLCNDLELPEDMNEAIISSGLPLFRTPIQAEEAAANFQQAMVTLFAQSCSLHGVFMDVFGLGVLLSGQSGIGKSELGLELITRGHGLVADDVVDFIQKSPELIEGSAPALLANLLEVRGIGLLDAKTIFGETAVRRKMPLNLIAELRQFEQGELMERLPETELFTEVLGVQVRRMIIPVGGGRNLAVLVEAAVRSAILQQRGINTIQEFFNRQRQLMEDADF